MFTYLQAGKQFIVSIFKSIYNWYYPSNQTLPVTDEDSQSEIAADTVSTEAESIAEPINEPALPISAAGKKNRSKRGKKNKRNQQNRKTETQKIETKQAVTTNITDASSSEIATDTLVSQTESLDNPTSEHTEQIPVSGKKRRGKKRNQRSVSVPQIIETTQPVTTDEVAEKLVVTNQIELKIPEEHVIPILETAEIKEKKSQDEGIETIEDKTELQVPEAPLLQMSPNQGSQSIFAPQYNLPVNNGECIIERSQLPPGLLAIVGKIREEFPNARLFLTGAAPANVIDNIKPNDYDILIIGANTKDVLQYLKKLEIQSEIRGIKYPVVFAKVDDEVSIDFSVNENLQNESINYVLMRDYMRRDFNLNALYIEFTEGEQFSVFSYVRSLTLKQQKVIETLTYPYHCFYLDPSRLFRLLKSMLENPRYKLSDEITKTLSFLQSPTTNGLSVMMNLFVAYIAHDPGNRGRLNQCIRKVFNRFSYEEINEGLDKLGLLYMLTNNNLSSAQKACKKIPIIDKEDKFVYWLLANSLQHAEDKKSRKLLPMKPLLALNQAEGAWLSFTNAHILHKPPRLHVFTQGVLDLIKSFNLEPVKAATYRPK